MMNIFPSTLSLVKSIETIETNRFNRPTIETNRFNYTQLEGKGDEGAGNRIGASQSRSR